MLVSGQLTEDDQEEATTSFNGAISLKCANQCCYGCSKVFDYETMYRCRSCNVQETSATDEDIAEPVFCKMCIVGSHLREDHDIVDHKGYRPAECETHMNLCHYYCDICAVVFCFDCIDDHMSHRFQPITLKATELRKEVFQYLTQNELLAKPMKHEGSVARNCFETKTALLQSLSENEISGTLKKVVDEILSCYSPRWANLFEQSGNEEADSSVNVSAIETIIDEAETSYFFERALASIWRSIYQELFWSKEQVQGFSWEPAENVEPSCLFGMDWRLEAPSRNCFNRGSRIAENSKNASFWTRAKEIHRCASGPICIWSDDLRMEVRQYYILRKTCGWNAVLALHQRSNWIQYKNLSFLLYSCGR